MNERLKELRKYLGLTQQEFGEKINLKRNTVATFEIGKFKPSDRTIDDICRVFRVNRLWLTDGIGEMIEPPGSREEELAEYFGDVLADEDADIRKNILYALSRFTEEDMEKAVDYLRRFLAAYDEAAAMNEKKPDGK